MGNFYYLDFEYRPFANYNDLVCCCILKYKGEWEPPEKHEFWLNDDEDGKKSLVEFINSLVKPTFVAFAAGAEIGAFHDLGLDPRRYDWECLHVLGKPMAYGSSKFAKHFLQDWRQVHAHSKTITDKDHKKEDKQDVNKKNNLVGFMDYFCGIKREYEEKKDMVDLILSKSDYNEEEKSQILSYCWEDVLDLPRLHMALLNQCYGGFNHDLGTVSETLCNWVRIQRKGIPLNKQLLDKAVEVAPRVKRDLILAVNESFVKEGHSPIFEPSDDGTFKEKYTAICEFIEKSDLSQDWPRTDTGKYKIGRDDTRLFKDNPLVGQWRSTKQLITDLRMITTRREGQRKKSDKKEFWDYISDDDVSYWQHPYYNPYGSITGRFQPPATSFIYAQPSWMRILIDPPEDHAIVSIDFVSQEIWIAAALSKDLNMMEDYLSGDPYLSFGKGVQFLPKDATKESHAKERNICKGLLLGLQFGMGSRKLSEQIGVSEDRGRELISMHKKRYWKFWEWRRGMIGNHECTKESHVRGAFWWLSDNRCPRTTEHWTEGEHYALTTGNFFIQGMGAEILRKTVEYLTLYTKSGTDIISTVHDEVNFLCPKEDIPRIINDFNTAVRFVCKMITEFPACYVDSDIQNHGDLLIKPKGKDALKRLAPYLELDI